MDNDVLKILDVLARSLYGRNYYALTFREQKVIYVYAKNENLI